MKMASAAIFACIFLSACAASSNPNALAPTGINNSTGKTPIKATNCIYESWKPHYPAAKIQPQTTNLYLITIPGANADIAQAQVEANDMLTAHVKLHTQPDADPQIAQLVKDCL